MLKPFSAAALMLPLLLAGCANRGGEITAEGITAIRSACPGVGIPAATGDITLFDPPASRDANAIDVVATITNIRTTCDESGDYVRADATFEVNAQRRNPAGAREVVLPYFGAVVQGGTNVVAKRLGQVVVRFADGQIRASATGATSGQILRSAATLPAEVRQRITRKRRAGEAEAALDPLSEPTVKAAVQRASFELLVGFQLTEEQLAYNATR